MNTILLFKNWRVWVVGLLVSVTFFLFVSESDDNMAFIATKLIGCVIAAVTYALCCVWRKDIDIVTDKDL